MAVSNIVVAVRVGIESPVSGGGVPNTVGVVIERLVAGRRVVAASRVGIERLVPRSSIFVASRVVCERVATDCGMSTDSSQPSAASDEGQLCGARARGELAN